MRIIEMTKLTILARGKDQSDLRDNMIIWPWFTPQVARLGSRNYSTRKKDLEHVKYQYLHTSTKEFDELTKYYFLYVSATINWEKGKTAEFWMKYIQLVHVYHESSRSLCEGDLHVYISCHPKFTNIFFALNHPNYAC